MPNSFHLLDPWEHNSEKNTYKFFLFKVVLRAAVTHINPFSEQ